MEAFFPTIFVRNHATAPPQHHRVALHSQLTLPPLPATTNSNNLREASPQRVSHGSYHPSRSPSRRAAQTCNHREHTASATCAVPSRIQPPPSLHLAHSMAAPPSFSIFTADPQDHHASAKLVPRTTTSESATTASFAATAAAANTTTASHPHSRPFFRTTVSSSPAIAPPSCVPSPPQKHHCWRRTSHVRPPHRKAAAAAPHGGLSF
ncbi:hypothetical protein DEO72_LG2g2753 [Vigna unguiculata]|uniref:Uncharacterized protein n=1 Tax=Vigna unguiculata TaxID=3917 RepID=A0A4D6L1S2_VIGUN|nr:hypothetical protein DEO72_LG2g2753 [Vigna unguiculata]